MFEAELDECRSYLSFVDRAARQGASGNSRRKQGLKQQSPVRREAAHNDRRAQLLKSEKREPDPTDCEHGSSDGRERD
jgi:hypothetical protein